MRGEEKQLLYFDSPRSRVVLCRDRIAVFSRFQCKIWKRLENYLFEAGRPLKDPEGASVWPRNAKMSKHSRVNDVP